MMWMESEHPWGTARTSHAYIYQLPQPSYNKLHMSCSENISTDKFILIFTTYAVLKPFTKRTLYEIQTLDIDNFVLHNFYDPFYYLVPFTW